MFGEQPFAVVENFIVSRAFRQQGIGKQLLNHLQDLCCQRDASKIMLLSSMQREVAHEFFTQMGFLRDQKIGFVKYRRHFS